MQRYAGSRWERVRSFFEVTDRLAAFDWTIDEAREHHIGLSKEMKRLADTQREFDGAAIRVA